MEPIYIVTALGVMAALIGVIFGIVWKEIMRQRERLHRLENSDAAAKLGLQLLEIMGIKK